MHRERVEQGNLVSQGSHRVLRARTDLPELLEEELLAAHLTTTLLLAREA